MGVKGCGTRAEGGGPHRLLAPHRLDLSLRQLYRQMRHRAVLRDEFDECAAQRESSLGKWQQSLRACAVLVPIQCSARSRDHASVLLPNVREVVRPTYRTSRLLPKPASFKSLYRKRSGPEHCVRTEGLVCRNVSDTALGLVGILSEIAGRRSPVATEQLPLSRPSTARFYGTRLSWDHSLDKQVRPGRASFATQRCS